MTVDATPRRFPRAAEVCPCCLLVLLTLCGARAASADVAWGLGRWQGKIGFLMDYENQDDKRSDSKYETILFQERGSLRNTGIYIIDPRILTLDLGGTFGGSEEQGIEVNDTQLRVGNGTLYDYAFNAYIMSDSPYSLFVFANRTENALSQGFGGSSNNTFESRGGIFQLREDSFLQEKYGLLNLTSLLDIHQELFKENSSVFGSPFRRDETHNIVRYTLHKGGEFSDFDLRYEFDDVSDPDNPTNTFNNHTLRAAHSIDFGPTLNRRLDSTFYYYDRTNSAPGSYISLNEGLHIDHHQDFFSNYRYDFSQSDSDTGTITTHNGSVGVLHRLFDSLTSTLDARATRQDFPSGGQTIYGGRAGLAYRRAVPWNGQLFAHTYGGYQVDDNNFNSSQIDVTDEPHTAPPVLGAGAGFTLNNSFVLTDTIVMYDVRGGSRLLTTVNVDYIVTQEGTLTKIIPLASSAIIQPGDPLEVSYAFAVDPSPQFGTATLDAMLGVEFPWFATSYQHLLSNQSRLSGEATPQFLIDQNLDRFELELHHQWNRVRAESSVAYEILNSTIVDSRAWRFSQLLWYQPLPGLNAQISSDQYLVDYPGENRQSDSYLVRGVVDWYTPIDVFVAPFAGYRAFHDTTAADDEIIDLGMRLRWTYRSLEVSTTIAWTDYRDRLSDIRLQLWITRYLF